MNNDDDDFNLIIIFEAVTSKRLVTLHYSTEINAHTLTHNTK